MISEVLIRIYDGFKYYITFLDKKTRYLWVFSERRMKHIIPSKSSKKTSAAVISWNSSLTMDENIDLPAGGGKCWYARMQIMSPKLIITMVSKRFRISRIDTTLFIVRLLQIRRSPMDSVLRTALTYKGEYNSVSAPSHRDDKPSIQESEMLPYPICKLDIPMGRGTASGSLRIQQNSP